MAKNATYGRLWIRIVTLIVLCLTMVESVCFLIHARHFDKIENGSEPFERNLIKIAKFITIFRSFISLSSIIAILMKNHFIRLLMFAALAFTLVDLSSYSAFLYSILVNQPPETLYNLIALFVLLGFKICSTFVFYSVVVEMKSKPVPHASIQVDTLCQEANTSIPSGPPARVMIANPQYYALPPPSYIPGFSHHSVQAPHLTNGAPPYPIHPSSYTTRL